MVNPQRRPGPEPISLHPAEHPSSSSVGPLSGEWKCQIFDRSKADQSEAMDALLRAGEVRHVHDELAAQIEELEQIRSLRSGLAGEAPDRPRTAGSHDYSPTWAYYPWLESLVHILPRAEFRELRLDRNRHKITAAELERLATSTIAVVGLSAGNVIARTLCLEGLSERFKLVDFDVLALSNMNRLEAGVHELGLRKTVLVARRLSEINPYVDLMLWPDGIRADNLDEFLLQPPRPDVLIEECDDLPMKLLLRERARAARIPVLMATSDRGMVDVERFDLEPDRPILHGLAGNARFATVGELPHDERLALVLAIVGAHSISTRAAASLVEMKQTISTWPQLASEVFMGGAATTTAVRRLLLGAPLPSGRHFIDLDAVLGGGAAACDVPAPVAPDDQPVQSLQVDVTATRDSTLSADIQFLVEHGCLAPSGGNCQPWRFYADDPHLWVVHDVERSKNLLNADGRGSLLALGAAIENVRIAATHQGSAVVVECFPSPTLPEVVARLSFSRINRAASADVQPALHQNRLRFEAIRRRVTNRQHGTHVPLDGRTRRALADAAGDAAQVHFLTDPDALRAIGSIVGECDRIRFLCPALHQEMMGEVRWSTGEAPGTRTGLALDTLGLTPAQLAVFRLLSRPDVVDVLRELDAGRGLTALSRDALTSSSAVGLIATRCGAPEAVLRAGQAFERLWLDATVMGIGLQPLGGVTGLFGLLKTDLAEVLAASERTRLMELEAEIDRRFGITAGTGLMLFRLSNAPPPAARSLRLPLHHVLFAGRPEGALTGEA